MRWPPREGKELCKRQLKRNRERLGRRKRKAARSIRNRPPGRGHSRITETEREGGDGSGSGLSSVTCDGCGRVTYCTIGRSAQAVFGTDFDTRLTLWPYSVDDHHLPPPSRPIPLIPQWPPWNSMNQSFCHCPTSRPFSPWILTLVRKKKTMTSTEDFQTTKSRPPWNPFRSLHHVQNPRRPAPPHPLPLDIPFPAGLALWRLLWSMRSPGGHGEIHPLLPSLHHLHRPRRRRDLPCPSRRNQLEKGGADPAQITMHVPNEISAQG